MEYTIKSPQGRTGRRNLPFSWSCQGNYRLFWLFSPTLTNPINDIVAVCSLQCMVVGRTSTVCAFSLGILQVNSDQEFKLLGTDFFAQEIGEQELSEQDECLCSSTEIVSRGSGPSPARRCGGLGIEGLRNNMCLFYITPQ